MREKNLDDIFNFTSPTLLTNKELIKTLVTVLKRPTIIPVPNLILNMIFGKGKVVLTQGQCVKPKSLIKNSFSFNLITYKRSY